MELETILKSWAYDDGTYFKEAANQDFNDLVLFLQTVPNAELNVRERPDENDHVKHKERIARDMNTGEEIVIPAESNADRMAKAGIDKIIEQRFRWQRPGSRDFEGRNLPYSLSVIAIETKKKNSSIECQVHLNVNTMYEHSECLKALDESHSKQLLPLLAKL